MTISLKLNKISTRKRLSIDVDYNLDNPPLLVGDGTGRLH